MQNKNVWKQNTMRSHGRNFYSISTKQQKTRINLRRQRHCSTQQKHRTLPPNQSRLFANSQQSMHFTDANRKSTFFLFWSIAVVFSVKRAICDTRLRKNMSPTRERFNEYNQIIYIFLCFLFLLCDVCVFLLLFHTDGLPTQLTHFRYGHNYQVLLFFLKLSNYLHYFV